MKDSWMIDDARIEMGADRPFRLSLRLPGNARAAAKARRAVGTVGGRLDAAVRAKLELLATELVTNSVRHVTPRPRWIRLSIEIAAGTVRLEVSDSGRGFVAPAPPGEAVRESGFGLVLVDQLADRWGIDGRGRTCVWVELRRAA